MPSFCAISSADNPEPRRNALSRWPISSKRIIRRQTTDDGRRMKPPVMLCRLSFSSVVRRLSSVLRAQASRRIQRCDYAVLVRGATAQIAGNADADVVLGRVGIVAQQFDQRGQDARRAEAALQAVMLVERLLQRMQGFG